MKRVISLIALILINANAWNIGNLATGKTKSYATGDDGYHKADTKRSMVCLKCQGF